MMIACKASSLIAKDAQRTQRKPLPPYFSCFNGVNHVNVPEAGEGGIVQETGSFFFFSNSRRKALLLVWKVHPSIPQDFLLDVLATNSVPTGTHPAAKLAASRFLTYSTDRLAAITTKHSGMNIWHTSHANGTISELTTYLLNLRSTKLKTCAVCITKVSYLCPEDPPHRL
jgi:hypothetical protein